ncbi:MAG: hypothetical protein PHW73_02255 [Atribacterota bacterium]|nr:hypothetical protein [Atribacterota bacterium]
MSVFVVVAVVRPTEITFSETPKIETIKEVPIYGASFDDMNATCTHSVVSVSASKLATSTNLVLAENYAASYRRLQNVGIYPITCMLDATATNLVAGTGIYFYSSSTDNSVYTINGDNLYQKAIYCISTTATSTLSVVQCY